MIIVMRSQVSGEERDLLTTLLCQVTGDQRSITATKMHEHEVIVLDDSQLDAQAFRAISQQRAVERVVQVHTPYKLVSRAFKAERSSIRVNRGESGQAVIIGGATATPVVMAGPCAVESREQLLTTARAVKAAGAQILRGGAFKPRTSPYAFQGLAEEGLRFLAEAREKTGLAIVTEWNEFREPDFTRIRKMMRTPVIFDGRNIYTPEQIRSVGFTYYSIGRR